MNRELGGWPDPVQSVIVAYVIPNPGSIPLGNLKYFLDLWSCVVWRRRGGGKKSDQQ